MIQRYERPRFKKLWSDQFKFEQFLKVELAASHAFMKQGLFDEATYQKLAKATFKLSDIEAFEQETKHDVIAFTKACTKNLGDEKKWFHYGLTSTDIVDSAQSLILHEVNQEIITDIENFMEVLKELAFKYKKTPVMGRTHGIHAEVTAFGLKFALYYEDFKRLKQLFLEASQQISIIKLSGAVGNFAANNPMIQHEVSKTLGIKETHIATQTLQRDRHAHYLSVIALIGSELEKIAVEIRHLSRTEVGEVAEYFSDKQKGSSAMPHKRNPVSSENITGLSRVLRGYMVTSYENISLWHERDISHSSAERIILADATTLLDYMLNRYKDTLATLHVYPQRMLENISLTQGVVFAQYVLNHLIEKGMNREDAYDKIQTLSHQALSQRYPLQKLIHEDSLLNEYFTKEDDTMIFSLDKHLKYVDYIFEKVFGSHILS